MVQRVRPQVHRRAQPHCMRRVILELVVAERVDQDVKPTTVEHQPRQNVRSECIASEDGLHLWDGMRPGDPDELEAQLGEYGRNLGLAFQIVDDVLDLTAAEDVLGKPVASDLREGKATLAVIHALERGTGADREAIRTVLADRSFDNVSHPEILEILHRHGSFHRSIGHQ